jgi:hypothetical protein
MQNSSIRPISYLLADLFAERKLWSLHALDYARDESGAESARLETLNSLSYGAPKRS